MSAYLISHTDSASRSHRVAFLVGRYEKTQPLIIDPVLTYSTYLGGSGEEFVDAIAVDSGGNGYVTGDTSSIDFPTASPLQATFAGPDDAFITKLDPAGGVVYSTYLGGSGDEIGRSIVVDSSGNVYVTGRTDSADFPTMNPLQPMMAGVRDAFVAKLSPTGSALVYSTYLGGSGPDVGEGLALDASNNAFVTGHAGSTDFPTQDPLQGAFGGGATDAFVAKLDVAGSLLIYSTYLGGNANDMALGIAVDASGSAFVSGGTVSTDFPAVSPIQVSLGGGLDAFVAKLDSAGSSLVYSTYLGGSSNDFSSGIAVDSIGNAHITGLTNSSNFPTANALQATLAGPSDAFATKLSPTGSTLVYSTYLGGTGLDGAALQGIALDQRGNVYLTGSTGSSDFPTVNAFQPAAAGANDAYVVKINASGSSLSYSTYLGGSGNDIGFGIAVDKCRGDAHLTGNTFSNDFPTVNPFQAALSGPRDGFVTKLVFPAAEQIQILINQVSALVAAGVLNSGQGNALDTKLQQALTAIASGDPAMAITRLQIFINQVNAFINGSILTSAQGQPLIDGANEVIAILSC